MILVDSHVHIYGCFNIDRLFDSAFRNFSTQAEQLQCVGEFTPILVLAEYGPSFFQQIHHRLQKRRSNRKAWPERWLPEPAESNLSIWMGDASGRRMLLVAGQQVVTRERLEVLALFSSHAVPFGLPLTQTICEIDQWDAIAVLSWSPGKWWGERGKIVNRTVQDGPNNLCLGDIRGRPRIWRSPTVFKVAQEKGNKLLYGTDPLNFADEEVHVGSYGFSVSGTLDPQFPANHLKALIRSPAVEMLPYGRRIDLLTFLKNQMRLRFLKRPARSSTHRVTLSL